MIVIGLGERKEDELELGNKLEQKDEKGCGR